METYYGHVRTPADAIILFEACRLGLLPRVQRRLSEKERQSIRSGSIFVWDEREAGMRRWTDGKSWSASRVSGSFLTYREMEGKRGSSGFSVPVNNSASAGSTPNSSLPSSRTGKTPESTRNSDEDVDMNDEVDGYRYKPDGLIKQSFSISTANHQKLHLISYYSRSHPASSALVRPSQDPSLKHIRPAKGMYPESTTHETQTMPVMMHGPPINRAYAHSPQHSPASSFSTPYHGRPPVAAPYGPYGVPQYNRSPNTAPSLPYVAHAPPPYATIGGAHPEAYPPPPPGPHDGYRPYPGPPSPGHPPNTLHPYQPAQVGNAPKVPSPLASAAPLSAPLPAYARHTSPKSTPSHLQKWDIHPAPLRELPPATGANSIPSVGALVSGPKDSLTPNGDAMSKPGDAPSLPSADPSSSRQGSKSPDTNKSGLDVQDIPSERMKFGEDARALSVLNRAFATT